MVRGSEADKPSKTWRAICGITPLKILSAFESSTMVLAISRLFRAVPRRVRAAHRPNIRSSAKRSSAFRIIASSSTATHKDGRDPRLSQFLSRDGDFFVLKQYEFVSFSALSCPRKYRLRVTLEAYRVDASVRVFGSAEEKRDRSEDLRPSARRGLTVAVGTNKDLTSLHYPWHREQLLINNGYPVLRSNLRSLHGERTQST